MEVELRRINNAVHFEGKNPDGNIVNIDGASAVGGEGNGMRPMQLMLVSVASCSAIDVVEILKKQRQPLKDINISVRGERSDNAGPTPFESIDIHFTLTGELTQSKVARAVKLAVEDYCSAKATLSDSVDVSHSFEIKSAEDNISDE
ncbi:MAG: OsmC family protein [Fodinibius sp.]|nr:OsmC family protein [Fodinibius sp.]